MTRSETILIIDDEQTMRDGCSQILTRSGFNVETAQDGDDGLNKIRELRPDVVLVDLKMPGIAGIEVLERIPEIDPTIIPIVITGYATIESAVEAMKKGAFDFLRKPFTPDELRMITNRSLERRRLIEETAKLQEEKRVMEENFITMVSHQLRSPLAAIQQYFEVILSGMAGEVDQRQREMMERAGVKLDSLMKLIDDWLVMARINEDRVVERFESFDLFEMVSGIVEFMEATAKEKPVALHIEPQQGSTAIYGDKEALEQAFTNIINNAIIYNRPSGRVRVEVREDGDVVNIEISDTGIGIPEKDLPRIFDQFYRAKNDETRNVKGTGLGLPIAKKIVESHGGSIEVRSVVGEGTTFKVVLPKTAD
jgi:signal transduction histidine kinase